MPSDEEVTQRAGRLQALTGFTERACTALRPPFRARLGGLSAGPHHRWATPPQPPVPSVWQRSLTHRGGQAALHPDLRDTASHPSSPRTTLGDVAINRQAV
jgi:hypothetical protein